MKSSFDRDVGPIFLFSLSFPFPFPKPWLPQISCRTFQRNSKPGQAGAAVNFGLEKSVKTYSPGSFSENLLFSNEIKAPSDNNVATY